MSLAVDLSRQTTNLEAQHPEALVWDVEVPGDAIDVKVAS